MAQTLTKSFEISELLRDKLAEDVAILAFANANFSQDHKVILGGNPKDPPKPAQLPCIIISGVKDSKVTQTDFSHIYSIFSYIEKEGETVSSNKITLLGYELVEKFRNEIERTIKVIKGVGKIEIRSFSQVTESFPVFVGFSQVTISKITGHRGN